VPSRGRVTKFVCTCSRVINDPPLACGLISLPAEVGVSANPLPPKSREKLPNKAMHLSRDLMFLMPVISLVHQLLRPGDGQRSKDRETRPRTLESTRFNGQDAKPPAQPMINAMIRQRRRFMPQQKAEAIALCQSGGLTILDASKRHAIHPTCLGRWVKQAWIDA
jgi:hypothetical protein